MDAPKLPNPVTTTEEFLYAIVIELRKLNDALAKMAPVAVTSDFVELREVEPKPKRVSKEK